MTAGTSAHPRGTSWAGSVVLNIGGGIGAAVVYVDRGLDGTEIEIRGPFDKDWTGAHTAVRPRRLAAGLVHAALFERLDEGDYLLRIKGNSPTVPVRVAGGAVTEVHWLPAEG